MLKRSIPACFLAGILGILPLLSQPWIPDQGDGTYRNPVIMADYSDPDVIRVGPDFYMVSSSFNCVPGLPLLHSKDLVNWKIVNHVFGRMPPEEVFDFPQHGNGCWAPSLRFHDGTYYVFFGDPDFGIYMSQTKDPLGEWEPLHLVHAAKGWIDPCPLWDTDGQAYLVHAFAGSRSGIKSVLVVHRMKPDGTGLLDEGKLIYDGHDVNPTIEGPKFYQRNGYYYIFAPAGGVKSGWQTVLRSSDPFGPYEIRTVMHQGATDINGPHQGGWVELENGESWFVHFQDMGAYGRVVHLNPLRWIEAWPVIGSDPDEDGIGEPVRSYKKPATGQVEVPHGPQTSDEFNGTVPGLQWQWHANPKQEWMFMSGNKGFMRLYCTLQETPFVNHWHTPHLLLQKWPARSFTAAANIRFRPHQNGEVTGLIIMGMDYASINLEQTEEGTMVTFVICRGAVDGKMEQVMERIPVPTSDLCLRVRVSEGGLCRFGFSENGSDWQMMEEVFTALPGRWIGAKVGLYASGSVPTNDRGYADIDWFRIE
jgi:beta-xylosidase